MEFLKIVKRRSFLNEVIYVSMNIALAIVLLVIIRVTGSLLPAFILVLLSKWRIFAVRTRFWAANIQANLVSIIVSFSYVVFIYAVNLVNDGSLNNFIFQCLLTLIYACWLLFLKPRSKRKWVVAQAGLALFAGITAIFVMSYSWQASVVVLLSWLVGYSTARHVLGNYDEDHIILLSIAWGLVLAEISWLAYHWTIAYRLPIFTDLLLPQISIIVLCLGFLAYKCYDSYFHFDKIRFHDIVLPLIFTIGVASILLLGFNGISTGIVS